MNLYRIRVIYRQPVVLISVYNFDMIPVEMEKRREKKRKTSEKCRETEKVNQKWFYQEISTEKK